MENFSIGSWEQWPDIDLYMDQVISFLERYLTHLRIDENEKLITPSIINNNTKDGILPKPVKKKYPRRLVSTLLIFSTLRQVLPTQDLAILLNTLNENEQFEKVHSCFASTFEGAMSLTASRLRSEFEGVDLDDRQSVAMMAMVLAIEAETRAYAARRLLASLSATSKGEESADKSSEAVDEE